MNRFEYGNQNIASVESRLGLARNVRLYDGDIKVSILAACAT